MMFLVAFHYWLQAIDIYSILIKLSDKRCYNCYRWGLCCQIVALVITIYEGFFISGSLNVLNL